MIYKIGVVEVDIASNSLNEKSKGACDYGLMIFTLKEIILLFPFIYLTIKAFYDILLSVSVCKGFVKSIYIDKIFM